MSKSKRRRPPSVERIEPSTLVKQPLRNEQNDQLHALGERHEQRDARRRAMSAHARMSAPASTLSLIELAAAEVVTAQATNPMAASGDTAPSVDLSLEAALETSGVNATIAAAHSSKPAITLATSDTLQRPASGVNALPETAEEARVTYPDNPGDLALASAPLTNSAPAHRRSTQDAHDGELADETATDERPTVIITSDGANTLAEFALPGDPTDGTAPTEAQTPLHHTGAPERIQRPPRQLRGSDAPPRAAAQNPVAADENAPREPHITGAPAVHA